MKVLSHLLLWSLGQAEAETQTSTAERDCLARHAAGRRCLVEIGVWHGVTTCVLRRAMAPDGHLYAVDPYPTGRLGFSAQQIIAHREVAGISNGRVHWVRATGVDAAQRLAPSIGGRVDFAFIDGDHTYDGLRGDWEQWSPLVGVGGRVALHDSRSSDARCIDAAGSAIYTREVIASDERFRTVEVVETLTVVERLPGS